MQVLFARADWEGAGPIARLISDMTFGPYYHTEVRFSDGRCFSSQYPDGVRFKQSIDTDDELEWDVLDVPWRETPEVLAWCDLQVGMPYDMRGAINSGIGIDLENPDAWFCSEIVAEVLSRCCTVFIPRLVSPNDLYRVLKQFLSGNLSHDQIGSYIANLQTVRHADIYA
jgi:hypothetical protein